MTRRGLVPVLPMALTLGNLTCGFIAMAKTVDALQLAGGTAVFDPVFSERILHACWFIVAAMVFDALDGAVARLVGQASPFGAQLDSLSDIVTFGVAPALMAKVCYEYVMTAQGLPPRPRFITVLCTLYIVGAALRLARYTVAAADEEHHDDVAPDTFLGLPSPAAAAAVVTTAMFAFEGRLDLVNLGLLSQESADAVARGLVRAMPMMACLLGVLMFTHVRYVHVFKRYFARSLRFETFVVLVLLVWAIGLFHGWLLFVMAAVYVLGGLALGLRARLVGGSPADSLPTALFGGRDDDEDRP